MKITYISHSGSDKTVVNAARVSFGKCDHDPVPTEKDKRLIAYLAKHGHWTPFGHPSLTVHVKSPIFVARQLFKHKIGFVENEISRRYVDSEPEFYFPEVWRKRAKDRKQGSSDSETVSGNPCDVLREYSAKSLSLYKMLIDTGVCPEQARMVLPLNTYTEWYLTGSLAAFARMYNLRTDPSAQQETRDICVELNEIAGPLFPVSWSNLTGNPASLQSE